MCVRYEWLMDAYGQMAYHKSLDPTSFDKWRFVDFQNFYMKLVVIGEEHEKKSEEKTEENSTYQKDAMSHIRNSSKLAMPKPSTVPKFNIKTPKIS